MPYGRKHRVQGEAHKHRDQHRSHDGQTKLVEELANDAAHKANR